MEHMIERCRYPEGCTAPATRVLTLIVKTMDGKWLWLAVTNMPICADHSPIGTMPPPVHALRSIGEQIKPIIGTTEFQTARLVSLPIHYKTMRAAALIVELTAVVGAVEAIKLLDALRPATKH